MLADIRYAVRSLSRAPWYAATVVGVVALGMALSTTIFAVVDGVLFKPLTYPQADRLVAIEPGFNNLPAPASPSASLAKRVMGASAQDIADWQAAAPDAVITGVQAQSRTGMGEGVNEKTPFLWASPRHSGGDNGPKNVIVGRRPRPKRL